MTAIFKKELASYLHSVTGWLFMAATIGFFAMYASVYNMHMFACVYVYDDRC